ncbi:MAG: hypothetical protein ACOC95_01240 [Planctomycetota bacterium]
MTQALHILLATLLLTAGPVRATGWAGGRRGGWRSEALSDAARAQLEALAADSDGALRVIEADGRVAIATDGRLPLPAALADWARRHGLAVPPVEPDGRSALLAAETVPATAGDRDIVPDAATAVLTTISTTDGRARWPSCRSDRPARPSEPMADAAVAPRAPPPA